MSVKKVMISLYVVEMNEARIKHEMSQLFFLHLKMLRRIHNYRSKK